MKKISHPPDRLVIGGFVQRAIDRDGGFFLDVLPALFLKADFIATRPLFPIGDPPGVLNDR
jgi:hypothetical protein